MKTIIARLLLFVSAIAFAFALVPAALAASAQAAADPSHPLTLLAAIPITPDLVITGVSLLANLIQAIRQKNTKAALGAVVEGVEAAAAGESDAKRAIKIRTYGTAAGVVLDSVLASKGLLKATKRK